jgi:hypothetical protein
MKVGDLVKCPSFDIDATDGPLGVVVSINNRAVSSVAVILVHNNEKCYFQWQNLEVINENR